MENKAKFSILRNRHLKCLRILAFFLSFVAFTWRESFLLFRFTGRPKRKPLSSQQNGLRMLEPCHEHPILNLQIARHLRKIRINLLFYRAYSTLRTSRMRVTLISPGYVISDSIFLAISRAIFILTLSSTLWASTITRTSRPA